MSTPTNTQQLAEPEENEAQLHDLVRLVAVAAVAGALTGVVGGLFRTLLEDMHEALTTVMSYWHDLDAAGALVPGWMWALLLGGACMGLSRWMVRLAPLAGGSGIQHVEGVFHDVAKPAPLRVLPIKFIGGLLAMAPGSALGREGPTVQMAAVIGNVCGEVARLCRADRFLLYTAVAGSGLAVAFNTPLAGLAFVNEEVSRSVTLRRTLVTLTAVATAMLSFWSIYGNTLEFQVSSPEIPSFAALGAMTVLGALCGVMGAGYNQTVLGALNRFDSFTVLSPEIKATLIGMLIGNLDFSNLFILLGDPPAGTALTLAELKKAGVPVFAYGNFLTVALNFLILALAIFLMVKQINRLKRNAPAPAPAAAPATPEDVLLLREIRDSLRQNG